jgi:hypothetical protein
MQKESKCNVKNFLQMQPTHEKRYSNSVPFDGHLRCCSPLHSTAHRNNQKTTDFQLTSNHCNPCESSDVHLSFTAFPYWAFFVLQLRTSRIAFKEPDIILKLILLT